MILHLEDDPKYAKKWPCIASSDLLKELENFMSTIIINGFGTDNGVLFVKPTGRQVDSSHRYYFCKESPEGKVFLYKKMKAGTDKGRLMLYFLHIFYILHILGKFFKVYTNKEETVDVLTFIINYMKHRGTYPTIKDVEQHYEDAQVMIARERIQICLNVVHSGVDITHRKTSIDYAIHLLPEIKAVSTTATTTEVAAAAEPSSERINDSPSPRSPLSSSATPAASPPSNDNDTKPTKRIRAAAAATNSTSIQINGRPTPMAQRLRKRKQMMNDITSPLSNTNISSTIRENSPPLLTSFSGVNGGRNKKISSKSTTSKVCDDSKPKKKVKTRR